MAKANPFRFSTKYQDAETGLLYYGYRYEKDGRWLSRDPTGEGSGRSLYGYNANNALSYVDPLGHRFLNFVVLAGRHFNYPLSAHGVDALGMTTLTDYTLLMKTRRCSCGIMMHDFRISGTITEYFAGSEQQAKTPINGESTLEHEDKHAVVLKEFTDTVADGAARIYGRCVPERCFGAWEQWWAALQHFAAVRANGDHHKVDFEDPSRPDGQGVTEATLEEDKAALAATGEVARLLAFEMKAACGPVIKFGSK